MRMARSPDWIVEEELLAGPYPRTRAAFGRLARAGIGLCINLDQRPLSPEHLRSHGMAEVHLPVRDFTAPSPATLARAVSAIEEALSSGTRVSVNCGWGYGRTGTVAACWLVHMGASESDAIAKVRERRPGSIETAEQEWAIHTFAETTHSGSP